eukprot:5365439-Pyramimonas_sp.AAC.1
MNGASVMVIGVERAIYEKWCWERIAQQFDAEDPSLERKARKRATTAESDQEERNSETSFTALRYG